MTVAAIVAMDERRLIGASGALPWYVPEDLAHFRQLTMGHVVVMGRKTWESLPAKFRPLPGRTNIVVTRHPEQLVLPEGVFVAGSPDEALRLARDVAAEGQRVWIIGGAEIYRATIPLCDEIYLTKVYGAHTGDAWLPEFEHDFTLVSESAGERCSFKVFSRGSTASPTT